MEYRVNRRTGDRISVLGVGTSGLPAAGAKEGAATLEMALEQGINYFDLATADSACFPIFGAALAGVRRQVLYQVHFGANYAAGKPYSWTTDLETVKRSVAWQLEQLRTDYIDYGFIHCMDESGDWRRYVDNGVLQFLEALKAQGVVRHIGLSTHTPALAREVLDTGLADMMMFSINPSYDYQHGEYANGSATERMALYRRCEAEGVGGLFKDGHKGDRRFVLIEAYIVLLHQRVEVVVGKAVRVHGGGAQTDLPAFESLSLGSKALGIGDIHGLLRHSGDGVAAAQRHVLVIHILHKSSVDGVYPHSSNCR